jgi:Cu-Zn family superoxide dismutase
MSKHLSLSLTAVLLAAPVAFAQAPAANAQAKDKAAPAAKMDQKPAAKTDMAKTDMKADASAPQAVAMIKNAKGRTIGKVTLTQAEKGLIVKGVIAHLTKGPHAIHIHAVGKCEAPKFTSAGGHFNPESKQHGIMSPEGMHAGDLPNLDVPASGRITFEYFDTSASLTGDNNVFDEDGAAVVVHAKADDYKSQPAGDAGDRVACGVIEKK